LALFASEQSLGKNGIGIIRMVAQHYLQLGLGSGQLALMDQQMNPSQLCPDMARVEFQGELVSDKVFAVLACLASVVGDRFQIIQDEELFVLRAKAEVSRIGQNGVVAVENDCTVMIDA